jgi:DNA-binding MarR family transcriptional regulator
MVATYPELDLDRQLCFPLYAAARGVVRAYGPLLDAVGLTYPQYLAMLALWGSPDEPVTVGELGERLRLDTGTLTPLLKRLESAGYVSRRRDPEDERRVLLAVTDEGWALRDRVAHVPGELRQRLELTADEFADLRRLLDQVIGGLDGLDRSPS